MYTLSEQDQMLCGGDEKPEPDLQSTDRFWGVLNTVPYDGYVPYAVVLIGLYSEQLEKDTGKQLPDSFDDQLASACPSNNFPTETLHDVAVFLQEVAGSLSKPTKEKIGLLYEATGLNEDPQSSQLAKHIEIIIHSDITLYTGNQKIELRDLKTNPPEIHKCDSCEMVFSHERDLNAHFKDCTRDDKDSYHSCQYCGNTYISREDLERHFTECDSIPEDRGHKYYFTQSETTEDISQQTGKHPAFNQERVGVGESPFFCDNCGTKYVSKSAHKKHVKNCSDGERGSDNQNRTYTCQNCRESFDLKAALDAHKPYCGTQKDQGDRNEKQYSCTYCDETFEKEKELKKHQDDCDDKGSPEKTKKRPAYGKEIKKRGGERVTGRNPFADTSKLKDAGLHKGGGN